MEYKTGLIVAGLESIATNVFFLKALFAAADIPPYDVEFLEAVENSLVRIDASLTQILHKAEQHAGVGKTKKE